MQTTLNKIRHYHPCADGWRKLLTFLGKTHADDEPVSIATVVESNGLDDALWCLRAVEGRDLEIRLFAVWCAQQVRHLMTDARSVAAIDVAERFANGESSAGKLNAAWDAAQDAARAAARDAAWAAARDAARAAARAAAWAAARAAARVDARVDAWDVAWDVAWDAERDAQKTRLLETCAECAK